MVINVKIPYKNQYKAFEDIKDYVATDDFFEGNVHRKYIEEFLENDYYDELITRRIVATKNDGSRIFIDYNTEIYIS